MTHIHRFSRFPLDEESARCRGRYPTTHNTHKRPTSITIARFELTVPASEWPSTHALDCAATRTCISTHHTALLGRRNQSWLAHAEHVERIFRDRERMPFGWESSKNIQFQTSRSLWDDGMRIGLMERLRRKCSGLQISFTC
jgi:hypothetical protein